MTTDEQTFAFCNDLERLVERYRDEFTLPYVAIVGALEVQKAFILAEMITADPDDNE